MEQVSARILRHNNPAIRELATDAQTELQPRSPMAGLSRYSRLSWSVDGQQLVMTGADQKGLAALFKIEPKLPNAEMSHILRALKFGISIMGGASRSLRIIRRTTRTSNVFAKNLIPENWGENVWNPEIKNSNITRLNFADKNSSKKKEKDEVRNSFLPMAIEN